jgi:membrane fusion protein (multidrug efflux system)
MENTTINQPKKKKSPVFAIILGIIIIVGAIYGFKKWSYSNSHEETDDAQIASNVSPVISKISGYVAEVKVKDNQFVKKGDTLIILDNRDQALVLAQAEAALGTAKSNLNTARAGAAAANKSINMNASSLMALHNRKAFAINISVTLLSLLINKKYYLYSTIRLTGRNL